MKPVWNEFPAIPWGSIGWRMGAGEDYWREWISWYSSLNPQEKSEYKNNWSEVSGWEGFYDFIENGTTPPWATAEKEKTDAAGKPPSEDEHVITERYRIKWLMTRYMKTLGHIAGETEEYFNILECAEPNGSIWLVYLLKPAGVRMERKSA